MLTIQGIEAKFGEQIFLQARFVVGALRAGAVLLGGLKSALSVALAMCLFILIANTLTLRVYLKKADLGECFSP